LPGGLIQVTSNSAVTKSEYDSNNNISKEIDALGNEIQYRYGGKSADQLTKVILPSVPGMAGTNETIFMHNARETVTKNANGQLSVEISNDKGQTVSVGDYGINRADASQIATSYEYGETGEMSKEVYQNGNYSAYTYDSKERLSETNSYTAGGTLKIQSLLAYDDKNRVISKLDRQDGQVVRHTRYAYDIYGRMTAFAESNTEMTGAIPAEKKFVYYYDDADRAEAVMYPQDADDPLKGVRFYYDTFGRLSSERAILFDNVNLSEKILRTYVYDGMGRVDEIRDYYGFATTSLPSAFMKKKYSYNLLGNLVKMSYSDSSNPNVVLEEYQYTYDKKAQIISEDIVNNNPANTALRTNEHRAFTYDALGRLTNAVFSGTRLLKNQTSGQVSQTTAPINKSYTYDKVGNRLTETVNGVATNHQYNQFNQLMGKTAANGSALSTYVYDANGNQLSETSQAEKAENEYDVLNRLTKTSMKKAAPGTTSLQLVSTTENRYNGNGKRIRKKVTEGSNVKQTDYYYQDGVVSFTRNISGAKTTQNILGRAGNIISTERFQGSYADRFYLYNKDQQGSVMNILDDEGNFMAGYSYDDFGQTTAYGATSFENEVCYTGGVYDASTSLYYLNARYYDPADGRFLTIDTYRGEQNEPNTLHLYAYCANNPVNFVDPSGHKYVPSKGIKYAKKWWNSNNPAYPYWDERGGDCANFVSQCLFAGGKTMKDKDGDIEKEYNWFCKPDWTDSTIDKTISRSWRGAKKFMQYWEKNSKKYTIKHADAVKPDSWKSETARTHLSRGDVVQFVRPNGTCHHTVYITKKYPKWDYGYAAHTNPHFRKGLWKEFSKKAYKDWKLYVFHMSA
jgi:RHS repeat-associated protein